MQPLQRIAQNIARQLQGLPTNSKLLIGSLMIILVMTLFFVAQLTGTASLAPLPVELTTETRAKAIRYIQNSGIPFEERGGQVYVPADRRYSILAQLTDNQLIGPSQIDFTTLMSEDNPFRSNTQNAQRYLITKMTVLGRLISQMDGVERAEVVIDEPERQAGIGQSFKHASASVMVKPRGELTQKQVDAIAHLVAGSHAGLRVQHVRVVDALGGRVLSARAEEDRIGEQYMEIKVQQERAAKGKLLDALSYIHGVIVEVTAIVDTSRAQKTIITIEDPKIAPVEETSRTSTSTNGTGGANESGVRPNTGANLAASSKRSSETSDEQQQSRNTAAFPRTETNVIDNKGYALKINATIGVPRSYFIGLYRQQKKDQAADPDDASLDALVKSETERIQRDVQPLIDTTADSSAISGAATGTVIVSMVPDFAMGLTSVLGGESAPSGSIAGPSLFGDALGGSMIKNIGLGVLAVISLAMMVMMVRRANVREALPSAAELVGIPPALHGDDADLVGEADESSPPLEGVEVDDDALRRQQMLDQINELVTSEPPEAAALLRRWMRRET